MNTSQTPRDAALHGYPESFLDEVLAVAFGEPDRVVGDFMITPIAALFRHVLALLDDNPEPPPAPPTWLESTLADLLALEEGPTESERLRSVACWCAKFLRARAVQALADVGLPAHPTGFAVYELPDPPRGFDSWLTVRALASGSCVGFVRPPSSPRVVLDEYYGAAAAARNRREVRP